MSGPQSSGSWLSSFDLPRVLLVVYAAVMLLAFGYAASTSAAAFSAYNPGWDGAGDLQRVATAGGADVVIGTNVSQYPTSDADDTVALVLSPRTPYTAGERARIERFVRAGGTLVVAEDYRPHGNELLAAVGADARFDGRPVYDTRNHYRNASFPETTPTADHPATAGVDTVVFNYGTTVDPGTATTLVNTSEYAYLDTNGNAALDDTERLASRPVVTSESVGDGQVVAVGDPSVFVNAMLERGDNRQFVRNLIGDSETVVFDYTHAGEIPPAVVAVLTLQRSGPLLLVTGGVFVAAMLALERRLDERVLDRIRAYRSGDTEPHLAADGVEQYLRTRYPDWDDPELTRVTEAVIKQRSERQRDD